MEARAKVYLGVISAFLAAMIIKAADVKSTAEALRIQWGFMLLEALPMTAALLLVLLALGIRDFDAPNDGQKLIIKYSKDGWPNEDQFYGDRIADYASASARNRKKNLRAVKRLRMAGYVLAAGVIYLLVLVLYAVWEGIEMSQASATPKPQLKPESTGQSIMEKLRERQELRFPKK